MREKNKVVQTVNGNNNIVAGGNVVVQFDVDREIDAGKQLMKDGKSKEAHSLFEGLWRRHNDKMTCHQKYEVKANIAQIYLYNDDPENAARYLFDAYFYEKDSPESQACQALGYYLVGKPSNAYEVACAVLQNNQNTTARDVWVRTVPGYGSKLSHFL